MKVKVFAELSPTENVKKVEKAIKNIFPRLDLRIKDKKIFGEGNEDIFEKFCKILENQKIRTTANSILKEGIEKNKMIFYLNRQAAFAGKVNFCRDCALGPIVVKVEGKDLENFVDKISPKIE